MTSPEALHFGLPSDIRTAESDDDIAACFDVLLELRPHLEREEFVPRVHRLRQQGYRLALASDGGRVVAVAGYRFSENLAWGRFLYVDDLVTVAACRSAGHGQRLFDWLVAQARGSGCQELHLDSGVQRYAAHRFYLRNRLHITSHHFALTLVDD
jgi:GNAT superfamily N-acetyltransferase